MPPLRDIGVRPQPRLQGVLAEQRMDGVRRVLGDAPSLRGQLRRELDQRQRGVQGGVEEERHRDAVIGVARRDHPVIRGDEVPLGRVLHHLADVHHEGARHGRSIHPPTLALDLEPTLPRLDPQQGEHAGVLVRADPLLRLGLGRPRVADDLDEARGLAEVTLEVIALGAERQGPLLQQDAGDLGQPVVPLGDDLAQLGLRGRPEVRTREPVEVRGIRVGDGFALGADVDLLAPVDLPLRALAADPGVAAEVRAVEVLDRELVRFGEVEERPRGSVQAILELGAHARAGEVEEADPVCGLAELIAESGGFGRPGVEAGEVEDRQR